MPSVETSTVILMYHRVAEVAEDPWGMCVSPAHFDQQLAAIRRVGEPLSLREYLRRAGEGTLPSRSVVVTFDDGYLDNLEFAAPSLARHEMPATLYVTTCNIDTDHEFWWDRLEALLLTPAQLPNTLALSGNEADPWVLGAAATCSPADREAVREAKAWSAPPGSRLAFFYRVWARLWTLPPAQRQSALAEIEAWSPAGAVRPAGARRSMRSHELRRMADEGLVEIGAHTVDHPPLPAHGIEFQQAQIVESRDRLAAIIGRPVTQFAYPHGEYDEQTIGILEYADFESAVTVVQKPTGPAQHRMQLPRFGVKDAPGDAFEANLRRWFELPVLGAMTA